MPKALDDLSTAGFEPATNRLEVCYSIQLSYEDKRNTFTYKRFAALFAIYILLNTKDKLMLVFDIFTLPTRFELVSPDSESGVLTTTLWKQSDSRSGVRTRACMSTMHLKCIPLDQLGHPTSFLLYTTF
jgi:hypothetical protein